jgi:hypothetical protein
MKFSLSLDKISQQPENCENRNDPDLVQAFLKKWWVKSTQTERKFHLLIEIVYHIVFYDKAYILLKPSTSI